MSSEFPDVPRLVLEHGRERARELVPPNRRALVDIAAEVLADENRHIGITYAGFCLTSLPHKRLPNDAPWEKKGHRVKLLIEPGRMDVGGRTVLYGVPYGARARMILLYLQSQAVRTGSPEVELGRSMRDWMERMGIAVGGETMRALRDQASRISACSLKFFWEGEEERGFRRGGIVESGLQFAIADPSQGTLWEEKVTLDPLFYRALKEHPVPLQEAAIRELRDRSLSLDIYVWLAWRLHTLQKPLPVSWTALQGQFGTSYKERRQFRRRFTDALGAALAAYPQAHIGVDDDGLVLRPSLPPVSKPTLVTLA